MRHLREADWSFCSDDMKRAKDRKMVNAIVTKVDVEAMSVQWQWQTPESPRQQQTEKPPADGVKPPNYSKNPPPTLVVGEDLARVTSLNLFDSCTVQLGDISFYNPTGKDIIVERSDWKKMMAAGIHGPTLNKPVSEAKSKDLLINAKNSSGVGKDDDSALGDIDPSAESDNGGKTDTTVPTSKTNSHSNLVSFEFLTFALMSSLM